MNQQTSRPPVTEQGGPIGWPQLSPYLTVRDPEASIAFYRDAFGFELVGETTKDEQGKVRHAGMRLGEAAIMFAPEDAVGGMQAPVTSGARDCMTLYVYVSDIDAFARRAAKNGADVLDEPADQFWGDRIAAFRCPDGYVWTFATHIGVSEADRQH